MRIRKCLQESSHHRMSCDSNEKFNNSVYRYYLPNSWKILFLSHALRKLAGNKWETLLWRPKIQPCTDNRNPHLYYASIFLWYCLPDDRSLCSKIQSQMVLLFYASIFDHVAILLIIWCSVRDSFDGLSLFSPQRVLPARTSPLFHAQK